MDPVEARARAALDRVGYCGGNTLLVVAVSGGPDSVALLYSLVNLSQSEGLRLHVAHLNHDFRGEEAEEDARFVATLANGLGLAATVENADPTKYQREMKTSSFEESAREARYSFLAKVAQAKGAAAVALGHTADDQAETVLMHIMRGTGVYGLRGMVELSTWRSRTSGQEAVLFRPFLEVTKGETAAYCRRHGIAYREDTGNLLRRFTRNKVRHELLPSLGSYNPRIGEALVRLAGSARLELDYLETELDKVWPTATKQEGESISLDSHSLETLHPYMRRLVLRRAYQVATGDTRRLEEVHLKAMADLVNAPSGKQVGLPRGFILYADRGRLVLGRDSGPTCPYPILEGENPLHLPSADGDGHSMAEMVTDIPGWQATARLLASPSGMNEDLFSAQFDMNSLGEGVHIRRRRPGDRFQPLGMVSDKKLQDFFVDEKVPRDWRDRVPLVVAERGIVWVVGYRIAEWAKVREGSGRICQIRLALAD